MNAQRGEGRAFDPEGAVLRRDRVCVENTVVDDLVLDLVVRPLEKSGVEKVLCLQDRQCFVRLIAGGGDGKQRADAESEAAWFHQHPRFKSGTSSVGLKEVHQMKEGSRQQITPVLRAVGKKRSHGDSASDSLTESTARVYSGRPP